MIRLALSSNQSSLKLCEHLVVNKFECPVLLSGQEGQYIITNYQTGEPVEFEHLVE